MPSRTYPQFSFRVLCAEGLYAKPLCFRRRCFCIRIQFSAMRTSQSSPISFSVLHTVVLLLSRKLPQNVSAGLSHPGSFCYALAILSGHLYGAFFVAGGVFLFRFLCSLSMEIRNLA